MIRSHVIIKENFDAVLFDLDGVLTDTAKVQGSMYKVYRRWTLLTTLIRSGILDTPHWVKLLYKPDEDVITLI